MRRILLPFISCQEWHGRISVHYCLFLQGVSQHLGYLLPPDSQPCPICTFTWGLHSVLEGPLFLCLQNSRRDCSFLGILSIFYVSNVFGGSSKVVRNSSPYFLIACNFRASCWGFPSARSSRRSPLFLTGCSFPPLASGEFLRDLACPKRFPGFSGLRNSWRDYYAPAGNFLGSIIHSLLFCHSATKKVYWDIFPDIQLAYFGGRSRVPQR